VLYTKTFVIVEVFIRPWISSQLFETGFLSFQWDLSILTIFESQVYYIPSCDWLNSRQTKPQTQMQCFLSMWQ
jgi:hypothetical protein